MSHEIASSVVIASGLKIAKRSLAPFWVSAVCGMGLQAGAARADTTAETGSADASALQTITVTARKRDESLATVPVSLTVFTRLGHLGGFVVVTTTMREAAEQCHGGEGRILADVVVEFKSIAHELAAVRNVRTGQFGAGVLQGCT